MKTHIVAICTLLISLTSCAAPGSSQPGGTPPQVEQIQFPASIQGQVGETGDKTDNYEFTLPETGAIVMTVHNDNDPGTGKLKGTKVFFVSSKKKKKALTVSSVYAGKTNKGHSKQLSQGERFYFGVSAENGVVVDYRIELRYAE